MSDRILDAMLRADKAGRKFAAKLFGSLRPSRLGRTPAEREAFDELDELAAQWKALSEWDSLPTGPRSRGGRGSAKP